MPMASSLARLFLLPVAPSTRAIFSFTTGSSNESGLQNHPLNPMTDPDIRRWLTRQSRYPVGLVAWLSVRAGPAEITANLRKAHRAGQRLVIVDALGDDDLVAIGAAAASAKLITGGSGVAMGLPANFIAAGLARGSTSSGIGVDGPEAILAGSCSGATRGQVERHQQKHPTLAIDVDSVMQGGTTAADLVSFVLANHGKAPLVFSSGTPEEVSRLQGRYGRDTIAETLDALFADTARKLVAAGVRRLVVAGGETSGAVVSALDLGALTIGPEIDPGVPVVVSNGQAPVAMALKSGNFGAPDFFVKALDRMAGR